jgi:Asp/Glu/hydantoin racemase
MRIWHQGFVELDGLPAYRAALAGHVKAVASPETVVDLHGVAPGTYTPDHTAADIARSPYLAALHTHQVIDNARRAEREGYDAVAIAILQDLGLRESRSLLDIPVAGYGEAAMHVACMLGRRFAVVAFDPELVTVIETEIATQGLRERATPIVLVDTDYGSVVDAFARPEKLIEAFRVAARRALDAGADVIIPGQTIMAEVLWQNGLQRIDDAPIIDALGVTIAMAELLVTLKRTSGMSATRRGYWGRTPAAELVDRARRLLG